MNHDNGAAFMSMFGKESKLKQKDYHQLAAARPRKLSSLRASHASNHEINRYLQQRHTNS